MTTRSWVGNLFDRTPRTVHKTPARFRPCVEGPEDRTVPSTVSPTILADGGAGSGSLRAAVIAANADPTADTIPFPVRGPERGFRI